jgi:hypothetical protein
MAGAFLTSRDIFDNPIWQDIPKFRIFFYVVGNAVFSDGGVRVGNIVLQRGQFLRSYRNLQSDLEYIENRAIKKYSLSVLKRKIEQLVNEERLKIEDTELGTLFTVVNYSMYQGFDHYKTGTENSVGTALERSENRDGTGMERSENNNKKDIKVNNEKNEKELIILSAFDSFWEVYPRKVDKKKAFEKFKIAAKKHDPQIIIQGAENYVKECQVKGTEKSYIKHPTSFLNAESFLNEFDTTYSKNGQVRTGGIKGGKNTAAEDWANENGLPF